MEETLNKILTTLQDYGSILRHIDQRFDTLEKTIELVRSNQMTVSERESALEHQCRQRHKSVDDTLHSLARRVTNLESRVSPMPSPAPEMVECEENP